MENFPFKDETYRIIGACMTVHKELGSGFLEAVYQEALELVFRKEGIPYEKEKQLKIMFMGQELKKRYVADFVCFGSVILELKALSETTGQHEAQVLNYLKATEQPIGLLVNFGAPSLQYNRLILS